MAISIGHLTAADPTFSATGAIEWNRTHPLTGATATRIPFVDTGGLAFTDSGNLVYSETSGPRLQVGSSTTSAGLVLGYAGNSNSGAIWASSLASKTANNQALRADTDGGVIIGNQTGNLYVDSFLTTTFRIANSVNMTLGGVAGKGLVITPPSAATTDVNALSATQTWNAAVAFKANKTVVTPTAYAVGAMLESWEFNTGQAVGVAMHTELTTIAAAATTDTTIQIPANVIVLGVSVRVTTVIPTAATFTVTGTTSGTAFQTGASVSTAANTTDVGTKNCPYLNATAQTVRITPNLTPADNTGRVRVTIHYLAVTAPTS